jgi:branched-chain amino acid transport system substrate-binding protein
MRSKFQIRGKLLAVAAAASLALTACGSAAPGSSSGELEIGMVANLSGQAATTFGIPFRSGFELAMADVKSAGVLDDAGITLALKVEDGKSETAAAVTAFNKLAQSKVPIVVHDSQSPLGQAIAPLANDRQVAFLSGTGSQMENPDGFAFRFTDLVTTTAASGNYLKEHGLEKVGAIVASDNPSFDTLAQATEAGIDGGYALKEEISSADTNFAAVLENLRAAKLDAIVLSVLPDQVGNILVQMKQSGGFDRVQTVGTVATSAEAFKIGGDAAQELVFPQAWAPGLGKATGFEEAYESKYGETPTAYSGLGYQAGWIVAAAILASEEGQGTVSGESIRDNLPAASTSEMVKEHGILDLTLLADGSAVTNGVLATFAPDGTIVGQER